MILIERWGLVFVGAGSLLGAWLGGRALGVGIFIGGALAVGNFCLLRWLVRRLIEGGVRKRWHAAALLTVKFVAIGTILAAAVVLFRVNPVGLLLGVSIVVPLIFIEGFRLAASARSEE